MRSQATDVLVVGSGIAGLSAALAAAREGASVTIVTKATQPKGASTWWAQGGIAVARKDPDQLKQDIEVASGRTGDPNAIDVLVRNADAAVRDVLIDTLGVQFDTDEQGTSFHFGREAAHSEDRILHVDASTGKHIHVPFLEYLAEHDPVEIQDNCAVLDLIQRDGRIHGAVIQSSGSVRPIYAGATILATGGIGALYRRSTNPAGATGDGIAMAARSGAATRDMEFVQFHPTVCVADGDPFLVSEAVRGEGAVLRNGNGERFMPEVHEDAELAPRDVVARAVEREHEATGRVVLDVSRLDFKETFPDLAAMCSAHGVNPAEGIPVVPAEHFLCGGIEVTTRGRSSLSGLYAVGECARTGVHGANRLASTSLLEGLVWGLRAGTAAAGSRPTVVDPPTAGDGRPTPSDSYLRAAFERIQETMDEHVGLRRSPDGLNRARTVLEKLKTEVETRTTLNAPRGMHELRSACTVALLIAEAARANDTSVGCHYVVLDGGAEGPASVTS